MITLEETKDYLRVDLDDEDTLIESLITASDQYLKNAGAKPTGHEELYKTTQKLLVSHWYEEREPTGSAIKLEHALRSLIFQLKWCVNDESG